MTRLVFVSQSPVEAMWWHIGRFRDVDSVAAKIRERHNTERNARKQAKQIRYCLEQAPEYYKAAASATLTTKPLLLYYGMAALAWAVVLFKQPGDYALERLRKAHREHGLERPELEFPDRRLSLPDTFARIKTKVRGLIDGQMGAKELPGTFGLFYQTVDHETAYANCERRLEGAVSRTVIVGPIRRKAPAESIAATVLTLEDLLFNIPDMAFVLQALGLRAPFVYCSEFIVEEGPPWDEGTRRFSVAVSRATPEECARLRAMLPSPAGVIFHDAPGGLTYRVLEKRDQLLDFPQMAETLDGRRMFYVGEREPLPESCAFVAAVFMCGMVVRYYPHIWMNWIDRRHAIVDVVEALCRLAEVKFPRMILNALTGDQNVFRMAQ